MRSTRALDKDDAALTALADAIDRLTQAIVGVEQNLSRTPAHRRLITNIDALFWQAVNVHDAVDAHRRAVYRLRRDNDQHAYL